MLYSIMVVKVKSDAIDDIVAAAKVLAEQTRKEPGCISYNLLKPSTAEDTVIFLEAWEVFDDFLTHADLREIEGTPLNAFGNVMMPATLEEPQHWITEILV
jgi:quinol monooxygenase YgiN